MRIALVTSTKLPEEHQHDSDTALVADELSLAIRPTWWRGIRLRRLRGHPSM
jgi:hypothetical protein